MPLDTARESYDGLPRRSNSPALILTASTPVLAATITLIYLVKGPGPAWAIGTTATLIWALAVIATIRTYLRHRLIDDLVTNLAGPLGWNRPGREGLRARRWRGGFRGFPGTIIVTHSAKLRPEDVSWQMVLRAELARHIPEAQVSMAPHPTKHLVLVITCTPVPESSPDDERTQDEQVEHVATVMGEIFGADAEVELEQDQESGRPKQITVKHTQGNTLAMAARRQRIERIVGARLPGAWRSKWDTVNNEASFTLREPLPTVVYPDAEHQPPVTSHAEYERLFIPYGVAENGEVVGWRPHRQPHMLVVGPTGAGKTTIEHQVIERLTQAGLRVWLCDGKRVEFMGFRRWPNVELIAAKTEHKVRMVHAFFEEMNRRYDLIESGQVRISDLEPIFMVVDEAATLVTQAALWYAQVKPKGVRTSKPPLMDWLGDIARLARTAKMHLLVGLQRPDVRFLDGEMRDNFACRASAGKLGGDGAQMMWDNPSIGAIASPVAGRGWATTLDGRVVETQFHYAPNPDPSRAEFALDLVSAVAPAHTVHETKHIELLEAMDIDLDGEETPRDFDDFMQARILDGPDPTWGEAPKLEPTPHAATTEPAEDELTAEEQANTADIDLGPDPGEEEADASEDGLFENQILNIAPTQLREGDLAMLDEALQLWGVIETLTAEDTGVVIDYRILGTGEPECITLDDSTAVPTRRAIPDDALDVDDDESEQGL